MVRLSYRNIGVTQGVFDSEGGVLEGPGGVSLIIPPGAIAPNIQEEIFFAVTDAHLIDSNNHNQGRHLSISPPMHNGELSHKSVSIVAQQKN